MEDRQIFRIGEVAGMFHISMGTLRHYEQAGLLRPEYVDPDTGYRYYSARQLEVLNTIRYLRVLDIPLAEIAEFLQNREVDVIEEKLVHQQEIIARKQKELELIARKIDHRLEQLRDARSSRLDEITVRRLPAGKFIRIRDSIRIRSYLDLETSIQRLQKDQKEPLVFLGKVGVGISQEHLEAQEYRKYDTVFLLLDEEDAYDGTPEQFDEQTCVCIRFCGSHTEAPQYYAMLMNYIREHDLRADGFSREITLIDYGFTGDTEKFVTEISIPVAASKKVD